MFRTTIKMLIFNRSFLIAFQVLVYSIRPNLADSPEETKVPSTHRCHIQDHPYMVSFTKTTYLDGGRWFIARAGVLLTLEWVLTSKTSLQIIEEYKMSMVIAGGDQSFYADYVKDYRIVEKLYWYKNEHDEAESRMYSLGLAKLSQPFQEGPNIQPVKLPKKKDFTKTCKNAKLVRFSQEYIDEFTLTCHDVNLIDQHCFSRMESRKVGRQARAGQRTFTKYDTKTLNIFYPVFCTSLDDEAPLLCDNDDGSPVFCNGLLIGVTIVPLTLKCDDSKELGPYERSKPVGNAEREADMKTGKNMIRSSREGKNHHIRVGDFMSFLKTRTSVNISYDSTPLCLSGLEENGSYCTKMNSFVMVMVVGLGRLIAGMV